MRQNFSFESPGKFWMIFLRFEFSNFQAPSACMKSCGAN
ncbi:hypothetical protein DP49_5168 [Burkholderia pseudomallei]|nr:hypothetical protein DP43_5594 [Burkholderia pseudomallei]KGD54347.1 hypothetical protein DP49_5168 [Burkholderia pseudomallei]